MNGLCYIGIFLLAIILIRELFYVKDLKIATKKTLGEILIVLIGIIIIVTITNIFSKETLHYILGWIAIVVLLVIWQKQGICEKGIITSCSGKQLYEWNEIKKVKITISNNVKVVYFTELNSKNIMHYYSIKLYDKILDEFEINNVSVQIENENKCPRL